MQKLPRIHGFKEHESSAMAHERVHVILEVLLAHQCAQQALLLLLNASSPRRERTVIVGRGEGCRLLGGEATHESVMHKGQII